MPLAACRHCPGITIHRRSAWEVTTWRGIPVTTPACTVIDIARLVSRDRLESATNRADLLGIATPETLRAALRPAPGRTGVAALPETLDRRTFTMTRSQLERFFLPIARRAGLSKPLTCVYVNGFEVDFWFPDLGLLVETDGLTYHRTPAQQARDRLRDQVHTAAGFVSLRFTHGQVRYEPEHVERVLAAAAARLRA